jgi:CheY-like chemotaxis protein
MDRPAPRLLIVEDDDATRTTLVDLFESEGFSVRIARDGLEALSMLRRDKFGAVLLDLGMPFLDGRGVRKQQLNDPALSGIPVVVLTGEENVTEEHVGGARILRKPFDATELIAAVRQALGA